MSITKKFSIAILDNEKISDVNKIVVKYSKMATQSSSHVIFDMKPLSLTDVVEDLTFFSMSAENETLLNEKLNEMIEELNQVDTGYTLRNEETGDYLACINSIGSLNIKFDNIKVIKEGTFNKIDELKHFKTELGFCKGYRPEFRPVESKSVEHLHILPETIFLFTESPQDLLKLNEYISEKVMEINHDFVLEFKKLR